MKQFIRQQTFETNSSSQHSIAIVETDEKFTEEEIRESFYKYANVNYGEIMEKPFKVDFSAKEWEEIEPLQFDRYPFQLLVSYCDKLRYVIASNSYSDPESIIDEVKEKHSYITDFVFGKNTWRDDEIDYGSVDHQSNGLLHHFLLNNNLTIEQFLTSKRYVVIIDGDEYSTTRNLRISGLSKFTQILDVWDVMEDDDE